MTSTDTSRAGAPPIGAKALARLRDELTRQRSAQAPLVAEHEATVAELTGQGDVDSILERELAEASIGRVRALIDELDAALARLDAGTYGACETCGAAIPHERLEAIPYARTCVSCPTGDRGSGAR
jgi:RNA polymerase-binding protein DksA